MPVFNHNSIELYYEIHGKGPPLIMLAGLASDSASWLSVMSKLTSHYTVAEQIPRASLKIIEGAAHSVHTEQPDVFSLDVIDFFEEKSEVTT